MYACGLVSARNGTARRAASASAVRWLHPPHELDISERPCVNVPWHPSLAAVIATQLATRSLCAWDGYLAKA
jgi:hypothetical protein